MKKKDAWFGLGISRNTETIFVMAFANSREQAQILSRERQKGIDTWTVFLLCDETGSRVFSWLTRRGISEREAVNIIRGVGNAIEECLDSARNNESEPIAVKVAPRNAGSNPVSHRPLEKKKPKQDQG